MTLHECCSQPDVSALRTWLDDPRAQTEIDRVNEDGNAPIHIAAQNDNIDIIRLLKSKLARKAIWQQDKRGRTAAHIAAAKGFDGHLRVLHPDSSRNELEMRDN